MTETDQLAAYFASELPSPDGRRRRAETNRLRIVEALIEVIREGNGSPSAEVVAERAGLSHRTVFRLFKDMDGLYREMQALMMARVFPMLISPLQAGGWRDRLSEVVVRRARVFEEILPLKTASDGQRARSKVLQEGHGRFTRMQREMLLFVLPEAVKADPQLLDTLDLTLSFESWRRLRWEQGLSVDAALGVMARMVDALVRTI
jgi:AcrR family transcriptional regulator